VKTIKQEIKIVGYIAVMVALTTVGALHKIIVEQDRAWEEYKRKNA
jgi:hypothetical protein